MNRPDVLRALRARLPRLSLRAGVAGALDSAGVLDQLFWLRKRLRPGVLTVLTYHRVDAGEPPDGLDPALVEVTAGELAAQLEVVRQHGNVVSVADVRAFHAGRPLPPSPVLVTFDDGYTDSVRTALPILRRAGVPATFFVATAFPDSGRLYWWDRLVVVMRRCRRARVELAYPASLVVEPLASPERAARAVAWAIKHTRGARLSRVWEELERATGVTLDPTEERRLAGRAVMSWAEVRALRDGGMDIQSHSHAHRILNTMTPAEVRDDLLRSRRVLREVLGEDVRSVAYPVGYPVTGVLRAAVAAAGFDTGFTNATGLCSTARCDPLNVARLSMDFSRVGPQYKLHLLLGETRAPEETA